MSVAAGPSGAMSRAPIRRTASFHYIEKIDEEKEEEDEEDKDEVASTRPANLQQNGSGGRGTKYRDDALKQFRQNQFKLTSKNTTSGDVKSYFAAGSIRNTAYDEEFFRVFGQYLDEAILKMSMQVEDEDEGDYGAEDEEEDYGEDGAKKTTDDY